MKTTRSFAVNFRTAGIALALFTAMVSCWWLAADSLAPDPAMAARLGYLRGRLWLRDAETRDANTPVPPASVKDALENAVALMPTNPHAWFALALAAERNDWVDQRASAALKMSYYTGFNVPELITPRLEMLTRLDTSRDPELIEILRRELRLISGIADYQPAIMASYRNATASNRAIMIKEISDNAPAVGNALQDIH